MPKLVLAVGTEEGQDDCQALSLSLWRGKGLVHIPGNCFLTDHSQRINLGTDRRARRAIALTLNMLAEGAGAASEAVMIRTLSVSTGLRGLHVPTGWEEGA